MLQKKELIGVVKFKGDIIAFLSNLEKTWIIKNY